MLQKAKIKNTEIANVEKGNNQNSHPLVVGVP